MDGDVVRSVAWVQLSDRAGYERALQLDGSVMEDDEQPVRVVPDRPPPPRQKSSNAEAGDGGQAAPATQRSRLNLMPRMVQAATRERDQASSVDGEVEMVDAASADEEQTTRTTATDATPATPMSNNDFRAMLMRRT